MLTKLTNPDNDSESKCDTDNLLDYNRSSTTPNASDASVSFDLITGRGEIAQWTFLDTGLQVTVERTRRPTYVKAQFADPTEEGEGRWCS